MNLRIEWKWVVLIALVCVIVFANSLGGEFVYDDLRQILRNPLIQDNSLISKALTSDVWAFKGDGTTVASNYWRPTFTAWHILNFRLFGANPFGWHLLNLLLHAGVCVLAFLLLRRWSFTVFVALAITLIFAVHPVHVESVSWISGSPDLLFSLAFLGSLWFAQNYAEKRDTQNLIIALILYAIALGAKEIGILCLPVYYLIFMKVGENKQKSKSLDAQLLFFGGVAVIYFFARVSIIGAVSIPPDDATSFGSAILSIPSIFAFYLRQTIFPFWLGANYPLLPVSQISLTNFVVPLLISIGAIVGIFYLAKDSKIGKIGAALFIVPLIPAMNATAFIPEQIVHDRYLYLPLLGFLMLIVPFSARFLSEKNTVIACGIISLILSVQTFFYNQAWHSDFELWAQTSKLDNSSFTLAQYANQLTERNLDDEAVKTFTRALEVKPTARGYLGRGRVFLKQKKYAEAESDLTKALQMPLEKIEAYAQYQTFEALAICYSEQKKFDEAVKLLSDARRQLPIYAASLTSKLAVIYYQNGKKDLALRELEAVKTQARKELLPESKSVFLYLGLLYSETGKKDEARNSFQEYLKATEKFNDKVTQNQRAQAIKSLKELPN